MNKNYFRQRVPGFVDIRELDRADFEFTTTQELLEHPYIKNWTKGKNSAIFKSNNMIIVKTDDGSHFVIGYVQNPDDVELPVKNKND
jgi:hypothetical protein